MMIKIERVNSYKYLGILIDDSLTFEPHVAKAQLKLSFYFRNNLCFSFNVRKSLVAATFLPLLDYGDLMYLRAPAQALKLIDTVYHASLRFITNCNALTPHCELYARVGWPCLQAHRHTHWCTFIYKAILRLLPTYLSSFISLKRDGQYSLRSREFYTFLSTKSSYGAWEKGIWVLSTI